MKKALALLLGLALALGVLAWGERHYRELEQLEGLELVWGERIFVLKGKHINSHGFRERELSQDKPRGLRRILAVGDSVTFGAGVRVHETWTRQAELMLADERRTQVVNLGVYSYDIQQVRATLSEVGWAWQPDLVVYGAFTNDHVPTDLLNTVGGPVYVGRTVAPELPLPTLGTPLLAHSALLRRAYGARAARTFPSPRRAEWGGDLSWWSEQLQAMAADCEEHGVPLLIYGLTEHTLAGGCQPEEETCEVSLARTQAMEEEAERLGLPFLESIDVEEVDVDLSNDLKISYAKGQLLLPLWRKNDRIQVAVNDPLSLTASTACG